MHELSIAMSIVEMAEEEACKLGGPRILAVHLKLGMLVGVVKEALHSSYELACEGTIVEGSLLVIEELPIIVNCRTCLAHRTLPSAQYFLCPECGGPVSEIVQGRELLVAALEVETPEMEALESFS